MVFHQGRVRGEWRSADAQKQTYLESAAAQAQERLADRLGLLQD
jgi:hypothetical protein